MTSAFLNSGLWQNEPVRFTPVQAEAEELGYFYIYLSNDSNTGSDAFSRDKLGTGFDDFTIMSSESYIVQQTDYYPYGMKAKNWTRVGEKETKDLFQGKTYEDLTKWYDFHARQYDAALGRWFGVDPQDQFASPYLAMGNNPVMMVDPDGEFAWFIPIIAGAIIGGVSQGISSANSGSSFWNGAWKGALIGAAAGAAGIGAGAWAAGASFTSVASGATAPSR